MYILYISFFLLEFLDTPIFDDTTGASNMYAPLPPQIPYTESIEKQWPTATLDTHSYQQEGL